MPGSLRLSNPFKKEVFFLASGVTNYQCPDCTGPLQFSSESGMLACEYCGNSYEVSIIEQFYADKEQAAVGEKPISWGTDEAGMPWSAEEAAGLRAYSCPSCGAEIICDETTAATSCVYCGNPTVVPGQLGGNLKPDYVIPFKMDAAAAKAALKAYYKGKLFLPKEFAAGNKIEELKGVYVPFWLFDGKADAEIRYAATKVRSYRSGQYRVTETKHYRALRSGKISFEKIPVDGSTKMPDAHMDAIEPFNYGKIKPFSTAYLPGFLADKYDVDAQASCERADRRIRTSAADALGETMTGYTSYTAEHADIDLEMGKVSYALLPVWMLTTSWQGKLFTFAMNGQTGKLIGDLPVSKGKMYGWFAGIFAALFAVFKLVVFR